MRSGGIYTRGSLVEGWFQGVNYPVFSSLFSLVPKTVVRQEMQVSATGVSAHVKNQKVLHTNIHIWGLRLLWKQKGPPASTWTAGQSLAGSCQPAPHLAPRPGDRPPHLETHRRHRRAVPPSVKPLRQITIARVNGSAMPFQTSCTFCGIS